MGSLDLHSLPRGLHSGQCAPQSHCSHGHCRGQARGPAGVSQGSPAVRAGVGDDGVACDTGERGGGDGGAVDDGRYWHCSC